MVKLLKERTYCFEIAEFFVAGNKQQKAALIKNSIGEIFSINIRLPGFWTITGIGR